MYFLTSHSDGKFQYGAFAEIMASITGAYLHGIELASSYQKMYSKAFENALAEEREATIEAISGGKGMMPSSLLGSAYKRWLENVDKELDVGLRSEQFTHALANYTKVLVKLRSDIRKAGYPADYLDRLFDFYVRSYMVLSLFPKEHIMTPFDVVYEREKTKLLHYRAPNGNLTSAKKIPDPSNPVKKEPLLIVYAPINTFRILDLNPERSVVRNLLSSGGLDIYMLDWGYPDWKDDRISADDYLGRVTDAVETIKRESGSDKISILGYCWGGIFALIYTSLFNQNVKSLTLMATPVDFDKDETILADWAKKLDINGLMDEFGHMDGQVMDLAFLMRNPPRYGFDKYLRFFQTSYDAEFVGTFIDVERWLYDTPPIPGELHRQIINECYVKNALVMSKMAVTTPKDGVKHTINLQQISVPLMTLIAEDDDLVSPEASISVNDYVSSKEKSVLRNPGGHVALCISVTAHKELWPKVAKWILDARRES